MKLSIIWTKAAKDFKQVRHTFATREARYWKYDGMCAMGAVSYYLSGQISPYPRSLTSKQSRQYRALLNKFQRKTGKTVMEWNDYERLTFRQLAYKARKMGL